MCVYVCCIFFTTTRVYSCYLCKYFIDSTVKIEEELSAFSDINPNDNIHHIKDPLQYHATSPTVSSQHLDSTCLRDSDRFHLGSSQLTLLRLYKKAQFSKYIMYSSEEYVFRLLEVINKVGFNNLHSLSIRKTCLNAHP